MEYGVVRIEADRDRPTRRAGRGQPGSFQRGAPGRGALQRGPLERGAARATIAALEQVLEQSGYGAVVLDADGAVELATGAAMRWLAMLSPAQRPGALPEPLAAWVRSQLRRARRNGGPALVELLRLGAHDVALTARFLPGGVERRDLLLLSCDQPALMADGLRGLGLTGRECDVLRLVEHGMSNIQIARALRVSERTIAKHLEHVYAKLGVSSRTAAVARARQLTQRGRELAA